MERVSFKVAKAIKEAGYPQACNQPCYITEDCVKEYDADYDGDMPVIRERKYKEGQYINVFTYSDKECNPPRCYAPTYIDVWLWLWKEKNIRFDIEDLWDAELSYPERGCASNTNQLGGICTPEVSDPEEAIIAAIEYLAENALIK